nr:uncharacterized protein LOC132771767 isoform X2 [Anolis sagrei ordinatus]
MLPRECPDVLPILWEASRMSPHWKLGLTDGSSPHSPSFNRRPSDLQSRDCKVVGDPEGAARHAKTARWLNIFALILSLIFIVVFVIIIYTSSAAIMEELQKRQKGQ